MGLIRISGSKYATLIKGAIIGFVGAMIMHLFILIKQSYTQQQFLTGNYLFDALIFGSVIGALVNKYLFK